MPSSALPDSGASTAALCSAELWQACLVHLAQVVPQGQIATWLKPLSLVYDESKADAVLLVANRFKLDWIRSQYYKKIIHSLRSVLGKDVNISLQIAPAKDSSGPTAPVLLAAIQVALDAHGHPTRGPAAVAQNASASHLHDDLHSKLYQGATPSVYESEPYRSRLNAQMTFDTLIEGSANRVARAAGLHVASGMGELYNPLFIYGGVGLGKTHLVHAIGNHLLETQPGARVLYLHAEQFVSDVVKAYQHKTFDAFRARYHQLDLLLIDDVQFFTGKDKTQEEFFNAFEALLARKSHVVMTSDTYPKELASISERLVSRFDSGLTVALEQPELELRVAILISKAALHNVELPEEVARFIAKNVRANGRDLEGALRNLLAFAHFGKKEISIALARESIGELLHIHNRQISVENIQKTVAEYFKIKTADMYSKRRPASIALPRQIAMYLAKELTRRSLPEIGDMFGGRDHTTVLHAVRKIARDRTQNTDLNQHLHVLEQSLKS